MSFTCHLKKWQEQTLKKKIKNKGFSSQHYFFNIPPHDTEVMMQEGCW